ncbi:MAG: translation elongation factor Ts [Chlamydiae bacterium RIFCSPHIGHO2_12_FULL_49_11]|nr:MAG: translation elongation factor Ts [Chlamydiae bacterium RIFCSPHIGHO2_12_FULL_49_11]
MITASLIKELRERTGVGMAKCKEALEETSGDIDAAIDFLRKQGAASAVKKASRETNEGLIRYKEMDDAIFILELNAETDFVVSNERFTKFHVDLLDEMHKGRPHSPDSLLQMKSTREKSKTLDELRKELISVIGENIVVSRAITVKKEKNASYGVYSHMGGKILCLVELSGGTGAEALAREIAMHVAAESPEYLVAADVPKEVVEKEREIAKSQAPGNKPPQIIEKIIEGKLKAYFDQACLLNQKFIKDPSITIADLVQKAGKGLALTKFIRVQVGQ